MAYYFFLHGHTDISLGVNLRGLYIQVLIFFKLIHFTNIMKFHLVCILLKHHENTQIVINSYHYDAPKWMNNQNVIFCGPSQVHCKKKRLQIG